MIIRVLSFASGVTGAAALSQFPEFSQQYIQRLAGQVDVLTEQVQQFDAIARADGMDRDEMLGAMAQTPLVARQASMWENTITRQARQAQNLALLRDATPMQRLALPHRMTDVETLQGVWDDYKPAVPLTAAGAVSAGAGFFGGWLGVAAVLSLLAWPLRRRRRKKAQTHDPSLDRARDTHP